MKKLLALMLAGAALLMVFGCSQAPPTQSNVDNSITLVQRPTFVETRPPEVVANFTIDKQNVPYTILMKRPPQPPPDTGSGDPNPNPAHRYAYIIGISNYEGTANDLQYCDDDAQAMKSWLQGEGFTCRMDLDLSASADAIVAGLQWLVDNAVAGDEIAFCYSGHGMNAPEGSSIISADLYYLTHDYVMSYINAAGCTKKLVTLDACVIGDFHLDVVTGTFMATASNRKYSYDAPSLSHGAWTYYWLYGVQHQSLIYAEDAAPYAETGMVAWAAANHVRVDPKHTDKYSGDMDM
jgi:uncharacterized caspase-like protein